MKERIIQSWILILGFFAIVLFSPPTAHAYLDPGSGSYIFQLLIGALLGLTFTVKTYWHRIREIFGSILKKMSNDKEEDQNTP